jgi:nucleotide-binding universal stress UspA family protein
MALITNILFPVDFSQSCIAMAPYVRRAATFFGATVSLIHVFDPASYNAFELVVRPNQEIAQDHQQIARRQLHNFLVDEFPHPLHHRIVVAGDVASQIAAVATDSFDLVILPTHAGRFRRMLIGSTVAKILDDVACPVVTSTHAETIAPRPFEHRECVCALGLDDDAERVLRYVHTLSVEGEFNLQLVHAIQPAESSSPLSWGNAERFPSGAGDLALQRIAGLQQKVGSKAQVHIAVGPIKEALVQAAQRLDADVLAIGRGPQSDTHGRIRDLTYSVVRDSLCPVLSV